MNTLKRMALGALVALAFVMTMLLPVGSAKAQTALQAGTSVATGGTITFTPPSGQYFYTTSVDITNCAGASAVTAAAVTTVTTTNVPGAIAWTVGSGVAAGLCQPTVYQNFGPGGLKSSAAGTATVFTLPTFATNQTIRMNVYGYFAP
jgi:hypothetical protein